MKFKYSPTVIPMQPFNPSQDAKTLRAALGGIRVNKKSIINVIASRTNEQRQEVREAYKTLYKKEIMDKLERKLKRDLKHLILALMTPLMPDFYIKQLHHALAHIKTNYDILIEVLCTMSNKQIEQIKAKYVERYERSLENDIKSETSGVFTRFLLSLCRAERDESDVTDGVAAQVCAEKLYERGTARLGTDDSLFIRVFCYRNFAQLKLIFKYYETVSGHSIEDAVKQEFSGESERLLLTIIKLVRDPTEYFAKKLNESMKGIGTDDWKLITFVVTRSEIDMGDIKKVYIEEYGESLAKAIKGDCSGSYKKCLLALIGEAEGSPQYCL